MKGKQRSLISRAFGAEPVVPDIPALAEWVAGRRGLSGDLTTYLLAQSLFPQKEAGITIPCAGGKFLGNRILESIIGLDDHTIVTELAVHPDPVIADTLEIVATLRGVFFAMPAPHLLGLTDAYYHDEDEYADAITGAYRILMRSMRDAGCGGHVLICDHIEGPEVERLAGKKAFFFHPSPEREDLEILLEYQRQIAIPKNDLDMVPLLADEYDIAGIVIMDPDEPSIHSAREFLDPDKITAGGYCTEDCAKYWRSLKDSAVYRV